MFRLGFEDRIRYIGLSRLVLLAPGLVTVGVMAFLICAPLQAKQKTAAASLFSTAEGTFDELIRAAPDLEEPAQPTVQDKYQAGMGKSVQLEKEGRLSEAVTVLTHLSQSYPQDFPLILRLAWLHFQSADYEKALERYRHALILSPKSLDAMLGIGWTLFRQERRDEAREAFEEVLKLNPNNASAREGLELTQRRTWISPFFSETVHLYSLHAFKKLAFGTTLSLPLTIADYYKLGVTGRYTFFPESQTGRGQGWRQTTPSFSQTEGYLHAGVAFGNWGLLGHYAFATDSSAGAQTVHAAALSSRIEALGTIWLSGSASFYPETTIIRIEPAWTVPLGSIISIEPIAAWQVADGESFVSAGGTLTLKPDPFTLFVGGRYGEERQPLYVSHPAIYNVSEHILWTIWAGASVNLPKALQLSTGYEYLRLRQFLPTGIEDAGMHLFTFGLEFGSQ